MEIDQIVKELQFKAVRSSGAGGQNVNKVSSKVVLTFDLKQSQALTEEEKIVLENKLANRLTSEQLLILHFQNNLQIHLIFLLLDNLKILLNHIL